LLSLVGADGKMREDLACFAAQLCLVARDGHVTDGALILNLRLRFWMVGDLAAQAALPIRIMRRIGHYRGAPVESDGDVRARGGSEAVVAGQASVGGLELGLGALGLDGGNSGGGLG